MTEPDALIPAHPCPQVEAITASSEYPLDLSVLGHLDLCVLFYPTVQDWPSCPLSPALLNKSSSLTEPCLRRVPASHICPLRCLSLVCRSLHLPHVLGFTASWSEVRAWDAMPLGGGESLGAPGASSLCPHPVAE